MIQITVVSIEGYGPWTLTLGSDREHELQMLQASLYREIQDQFSRRGCLAFLNRGDEYFAATSGMTLEDHAAVQEHVGSRFDLRLSMSVGCAETPYEANLRAFEARRSGAPAGVGDGIYAPAGGLPGGGHRVTVMHMDMEDLTSSRRTRSPYDVSGSIFSLYSRMCGFFAGRGSLAFFLGGDNFMVLAHGDPKPAAGEFMDAARGVDGTELNCGIGHAPTPRRAAMLATKSLDTIREMRDSGGGGGRPRIRELSC